MEFIPDQPKEAGIVPFFDDVQKDGGWQGQGTSKSIETLKSEIMAAISRLGGLVVGFQRGTFMMKREGFRVHYTIDSPNGKMIPGRIDIAALPVKDDYRLRRSFASRKEQSLKMALYMFRDAMDGLWFLQQLSPGYAPLMPFMMADKDKTISQLWADSSLMKNILPPGDGFIDAEFSEKA